MMTLIPWDTIIPITDSPTCYKVRLVLVGFGEGDYEELGIGDIEGKFYTLTMKVVHGGKE